MLNLLEKLKNEGLILETQSNQYGEEIPMKKLTLEDGRFHYSGVSCRNSALFGLGTCQCNTHPARFSMSVSAEKGVQLLQEYLEKLEHEKNEKELDRKKVQEVLSALEEVC